MRQGLSGLAILAGAVATGAAAQQDCPVAADLSGGGIEFSITDGATEIFTQETPGIVTSIYSDDGYTGRVVLAKGYYLLELIDLENGVPVPDTRTIYVYPDGQQSGPDPQPGLTWQVEALVRDPGDGLLNARREVQVYSFGEIQPFAFGACQYDMIEIRVDYPGENPASHDLLHYFPALGLSYLAGGQTGDAEPESYLYSAIRRVP